MEEDLSNRGLIMQDQPNIEEATNTGANDPSDVVPLIASSPIEKQRVGEVKVMPFDNDGEGQDSTMPR